MSLNVRSKFGRNEANRLAHSGGVVDPLHCLEFDLARDQSRPARPAPDFVRRDSVPHRDHRSDCGFGWPRPSAAKTPVGLWGARFHRRAHVRDQLCALVLG